MNLNLINKLQSGDSAHLIIQPKAGDVIDYYIVIRNISFDIVSSGKFFGTIENNKSVSFEIRLSSIIPLVTKGYSFNIYYENGILSFVSEDESLIVTPSFVESHDKASFKVVERYIEFSETLMGKENSKSTINDLETELNILNNKRNHLNLMNLLDKTENLNDVVYHTVDEDLESIIEEKINRLDKIKFKYSEISELDLTGLYDLATAAAKVRTVIDMCGDYAIVSLNNSFLLEKKECPILSVQGVLMNVLLKDNSKGSFYMYKDELVYVSGDKDLTVVFISKYLPNNTVNSSIVTSGVVTEKYNIRFSGLIKILSLVNRSFKSLVIDMNSGVFVLTNELNETIKIKFSVESLNSLQMIRAKNGSLNLDNIKFSVIDIPVEVQQVLNLFKEDITIYVKKNKIIFQNGNLYLVFGR